MKFYGHFSTFKMNFSGIFSTFESASKKYQSKPFSRSTFPHFRSRELELFYYFFLLSLENYTFLQFFPSSLEVCVATACNNKEEKILNKRKNSVCIFKTLECDETFAGCKSCVRNASVEGKISLSRAACNDSSFLL